MALRSFFRSKISSAIVVAASMVGGIDPISFSLTKPPIMRGVRVLLISTYELGRQPFGLASPAAWLRAEGHEVTLADLSCGQLPGPALEQASLVAFFLPMHTATRLALGVVDKVRAANPGAHLCGYGLYAPLNAERLRNAGFATVIGGEFEQPLVDLARRLECSAPGVGQLRAFSHLKRQKFQVPDRAGLPPLASYAQLVVNGSTRRVGYTEASRGCKHKCRHCPVVPVYRGVFASCSRRWSWKTSGGKWPPAPSISPSAIPTF